MFLFVVERRNLLPVVPASDAQAVNLLQHQIIASNFVKCFSLRHREDLNTLNANEASRTGRNIRHEAYFISSKLFVFELRRRSAPEAYSGLMACQYVCLRFDPY